jgi:hypothetical protein
LTQQLKGGVNEAFVRNNLCDLASKGVVSIDHVSACKVTSRVEGRGGRGCLMATVMAGVLTGVDRYVMGQVMGYVMPKAAGQAE